MPRRGVRPLRSRGMLATLKLITGRCAKYYQEGLNEFDKRQLIQDIWRYANFAIIADNKRARAKRRKPRKPKGPDRRYGKRKKRDTGFRCEAAVFNMAECATQCARCRESWT